MTYSASRELMQARDSIHAVSASITTLSDSHPRKPAAKPLADDKIAYSRQCQDEKRGEDTAGFHPPGCMTRVAIAQPTITREGGGSAKAGIHVRRAVIAAKVSEAIALAVPNFQKFGPEISRRATSVVPAINAALAAT